MNWPQDTPRSKTDRHSVGHPTDYGSQVGTYETAVRKTGRSGAHIDRHSPAGHKTRRKDEGRAALVQKFRGSFESLFALPVPPRFNALHMNTCPQEEGERITEGRSDDGTQKNSRERHNVPGRGEIPRS